MLSTYQPGLAVPELVANRQRIRKEWPAYFGVSLRFTTVSMNPPLFPDHADSPAKSLRDGGGPVAAMVVVYPLLARTAPDDPEVTSNHAPLSSENSSLPPSWP